MITGVCGTSATATERTPLHEHPITCGDDTNGRQHVQRMDQLGDMERVPVDQQR